MDKYLITLAILLLFGEGVWLLHDLEIIQTPHYFSQNLKSNSNAMGRVATTKRVVKKRNSDSLVWEDARESDNLFAYDSVITMDHSAAELNLADETKITLQENTLVSIEPSQNLDQPNALLLHFKKGAFRAVASVSGSQVETGEWTLAVSPKSQIAVHTTGDGALSVETEKGSVQVLNSQTREVMSDLKSGEMVDLNLKSPPIVQKVLDIKWEKPEQGERIYTHSLTTNLSLKWVGEATELLVRRADDPKDKEWVTSLNPGQNEILIPMSSGPYVLRLRNREEVSFSRDISIWPAPQLFLLSPLIRERIRIHTPIKLQWTNHDEVATYAWQVATDKEFKNIVSEGQTQKNSQILNDLPKGEYFWRVIGLDGSGFVIPPFYENSFFILDKFLEAPKLKAPKVKRQKQVSLWDWIIPKANAEGEEHFSAEFQWEEVSGAEQYNIEISEDPHFRKILVTETTKSPGFVWKNFKLAKYYWRVAAQAQGEMGLYSETAFADLTTLPTEPIVPVPVATAPPPSTPVTNTMPSPTPEPLVEKVLPQEKGIWSFQLLSGGSFSYSNFKSTDFSVKTSGFHFGEFKLEVAPPPDVAALRFQAEYSKAILKPKKGQEFQDNLKNDTFRFALIQESPYKGKLNFGLSAHNQYSIFGRDTLESVMVKNPIYGGLVLEYRMIDELGEENIVLGAFAGNGGAIDGRMIESWFFDLTGELKWTFSVQGSVVVGFVESQRWWFSGGASAYFGLRW